MKFTHVCENPTHLYWWKVPEASTLLSHRNPFSILCNLTAAGGSCLATLWPDLHMPWSSMLFSSPAEIGRVKKHMTNKRSLMEPWSLSNQALEPWQRARCQSLAKWIGARCTQDVINGTELLVASRAAGLNSAGMSNFCQSLSRQAAAWGEHPSRLQVPRSLSEAHPNREA